MWKLIDIIITAPAWTLGYLWVAYKNTFLYGGECYKKNVSRYWNKW